MKWPATLSCSVLLLFASTAFAQSQTQQSCVAAHADGQTLRNDSKLIAAKERFTSCAQTDCPALVQAECARLLGEVEAMLPSLVITARDASGRDLRDVRAMLDGRSLGEALDGKAVVVDPGPHHLRAERKGEPALEQDIVVAQGEKNRMVVIQFGGAVAADAATPPPRPPKPPEESGGVSPLVWIGFGIGGACVVAGAITGGITLARASDLKDRCPGNVCAEEQRDHYDTTLMLSRISTVMLAVGGVGVALGVVGLFLSDDDEPPASAILGPGYLGIRGRL